MREIGISSILEFLNYRRSHEELLKTRVRLKGREEEWVESRIVIFVNWQRLPSVLRCLSRLGYQTGRDWEMASLWLYRDSLVFGILSTQYDFLCNHHVFMCIRSSLEEKSGHFSTSQMTIHKPTIQQSLSPNFSISAPSLPAENSAFKTLQKLKYNNLHQNIPKLSKYKDHFRIFQYYVRLKWCINVFITLLLQLINMGLFLSITDYSSTVFNIQYM